MRPLIDLYLFGVLGSVLCSFLSTGYLLILWRSHFWRNLEKVGLSYDWELQRPTPRKKQSYTQSVIYYLFAQSLNALSSWIGIAAFFGSLYKTVIQFFEYSREQRQRFLKLRNQNLSSEEIAWIVSEWYQIELSDISSRVPVYHNRLSQEASDKNWNQRAS